MSTNPFNSFGATPDLAAESPSKPNTFTNNNAAQQASSYQGSAFSSNGYLDATSNPTSYQSNKPVFAANSSSQHTDDGNDTFGDNAPDMVVGRGARDGAIHEKPLSAFISSVPDELCGQTAEFNPFQFWNRDGDEIDKWSEQITDAIETAVTRHHRGFNQATTEFDEILSAFHDSEQKLKRLISNLLEAKKLLAQSRGENGKTASIRQQWQHFEDYKKKLKELDKVEYILEIPQIFEKYLIKKQFIHATVLLEDGLSLYATSLSEDSSQQLQAQHQIILNKKNDLEKLLSQQLYQQIYFKTNSLRSNLLRPPKRTANKNILNLLNIQQEMMMLDEDEDEKKGNQTPSRNSLAVTDNSKSPHFKAAPSVHYDTLASLNKDTQSYGIGSSQHKSKFKSGARKGAHHVLSAGGASAANSIQDPYKIIVPTYKSFRNLDDVKDDSVQPQIFGNVQQLLVAETTDEYLKLSHNNNNYNEDEQPLFLRICVTAIDKLGRSVGAKTQLFKSLDIELKEIIGREIYEVCNAFQQQMIQSNQLSNIPEPDDQSMMLLNATQNVFKIFSRVLSNHKTVVEVFDQSERSFSRKSPNKSDRSRTSRLHQLKTYTVQSVWNSIQKSILHHLLKRYLEQDLSSNKKEEKKKSHHSHHDDMSMDIVETDDNILRVRTSPSRSVSPQPSPVPPGSDNKGSKGFGGLGSRLKDTKFFKKARKFTADTMGVNAGANDTNYEDGTEETEEHKNNDPIDPNRDLFASAISSKYHDLAMDKLTFSFNDSNIGSIVLNKVGLSTGHIREETATDFGIQKRISLSPSNLQNLSGLNSLGRDRSGTGLDAFSIHRGKRGMSTYAQHGKHKNNKNSSGQKHGDDKSTKKQKSFKSKRRKQLNLIEASPYHVTKLYKPVVHFIEHAEWKILGLFGDVDGKKIPNRKQMEEYHERRKKEAISEEIDLREFLKEFVKTTFIPNMQAEAASRMHYVLLEDQPWDQMRINEEPLLLLKSTEGIFELVKTLFEYYVVLPVFDSDEFVAMVRRILFKFYETYDQEIDEICGGVLISRDLIYSKNKYLALLNAWNLRQLFADTEKLKDDQTNAANSSTARVTAANYDDHNSDSEPDEYAANEAATVDKYAYEQVKENKKDLSIQHYLLLKNEDKIPMSHSGVPQFNTEHYSKLALMSTGIFWLSRKITSELITPVTHGSGAFGAGDNEMQSRLRKSTTSHASLGKLCEYLAETFEPRAEECISVIRMEIRSQIVSLLKNIAKNNYWMPEDSIINKPQDFIITLNKLLVSLEGKLAGCLSERLIRFLFEEIAYFICEVIIDQIPRVVNHKINITGYKQLYKNTFSLQQNLTTITQKGMEKCFDRAQKYLKLSQKTPEDIEKIQEIKNKKSYGAEREKYAAYDFSKEQYAAISQVAKFSNAHRK